MVTLDMSESCPNCHAAVPVNASVCSQCNESVEKLEPQSVSDRDALLTHAIERASQVGWQLVSRTDQVAELWSTDGHEQLYLLVQSDGSISQSQRVGPPLAWYRWIPGFRSGNFLHEVLAFCVYCFLAYTIIEAVIVLGGKESSSSSSNGSVRSSVSVSSSSHSGSRLSVNEYSAKVKEEADILGPALLEFSSLVQYPNSNDPKWRGQLGASLAFWKVEYEDAAKLNPPTCLSAANNTWVSALRSYNDAADLIVKSLDNGNTTLMQEALGQMHNANESIKQMSELIQSAHC